MNVWVKIQIAPDGRLDVNMNLPVDRALGLIEMGKFAMLNTVAKPTPEIQTGEAPAATMRTPLIARRVDA